MTPSSYVTTFKSLESEQFEKDIENQQPVTKKRKTEQLKSRDINFKYDEWVKAYWATNLRPTIGANKLNARLKEKGLLKTIHFRKWSKRIFLFDNSGEKNHIGAYHLWCQTVRKETTLKKPKNQSVNTAKENNTSFMDAEVILSVSPQIEKVYFNEPREIVTDTSFNATKTFSKLT